MAVSFSTAVFRFSVLNPSRFRRTLAMALGNRSALSTFVFHEKDTMD